jgi:pyruvate kinase
VAVCLDIMGPEIRTGPHKDNLPIDLKKDQILKISIDPDLEGDAEGIGCNYESLLNHTKIGKLIYI